MPNGNNLDMYDKDKHKYDYPEERAASRKKQLHHHSERSKMQGKVTSKNSETPDQIRARIRRTGGNPTNAEMQKLSGKSRGEVNVHVIPIHGRDIAAIVDGGHSIGGIMEVEGKSDGVSHTVYLTGEPGGSTVNVRKSKAQALKDMPAGLRKPMQAALNSSAGQTMTVSRAKQIMAERASRLKGGASRFGAKVGALKESARKMLSPVPQKVVPQHRAKRGSGVTRRRDR